MEKEFVSMELIMLKDIVSMKKLKNKSFVSEDFSNGKRICFV